MRSIYAAVRSQLTVERITPVAMVLAGVIVAGLAKVGFDLDPAPVSAVIVAFALAAVKFLDMRTGYNATPEGQMDEANRKQRNRRLKLNAGKATD